MSYLKIDGWEDPSEQVEKKLTNIQNRVNTLVLNSKWCIETYETLMVEAASVTDKAKLKLLHKEVAQLENRVAYESKQLKILKAELDVILALLRSRG